MRTQTELSKGTVLNISVLTRDRISFALEIPGESEAQRAETCLTPADLRHMYVMLGAAIAEIEDIDKQEEEQEWS